MDQYITHNYSYMKQTQHETSQHARKELTKSEYFYMSMAFVSLLMGKKFRFLYLLSLWSATANFSALELVFLECLFEWLVDQIYPREFLELW